MCSRAAIIFTAILMATSSTTTHSWTANKTHHLDKFVAELMKCRDIVGLSIAIVSHGDTVLAKGYGFRDKERQQTVNDATRFSIGSQTKAFTAVLAADSVGKGAITWDQPVRSMFGDDFQLQDEYRTKEASVRDLLSHRLGVANYWGFTTAAVNISNEEFSTRRMRYMPTIDGFRVGFQYSNYGYVLAAAALEKVRGKSWVNDVEEIVFKPLGMADTRVSCHLTSDDWNNTANSYTIINGIHVKNREKEQISLITGICPAGCIFSSARDMAKWLIFHLGHANTSLSSGDQLLNTADLDSVYKPVCALDNESPEIKRPLFPVEDSRDSYGLGFFNGHYRGMRKVYHTGSYSSYNCRLTLLPDMSVGVWVCVNSPGDRRAVYAARLLNMFALDLILDLPPWLNETTACSFPEPWLAPTSTITGKSSGIKRAPNNSAMRPLHHYVGEYCHRAFGKFTVFLTNGSLRYRFGTLLRGTLSGSETDHKLYMSVDPPLDYRMSFYPDYPNGFPVYFSGSREAAIEMQTIKVPYLEFALPPEFARCACSGQCR